MDYKVINGMKIYAPFSDAELVAFIEQKKKLLIALNAEKLLFSEADFRAIVNSNIGYPDGFGAVIALRRKGCLKSIKVPGCELWLRVIEEFWASKTFYLIGASDEVIDATVQKLRRSFPQIQILGFRNGYFTGAEDKNQLIDRLKTFQPDVVFVAMGSPKQEQLMYDLSQVHSALYMGLGGSFDVYVGKVKRAPAWFVKHNLEWAYRLMRQPSRARRQLKLVPFMFRVLFNRI